MFYWSPAELSCLVSSPVHDQKDNFSAFQWCVIYSTWFIGWSGISIHMATSFWKIWKLLKLPLHLNDEIYLQRWSQCCVRVPIGCLNFPLSAIMKRLTAVRNALTLPTSSVSSQASKSSVVRVLWPAAATMSIFPAVSPMVLKSRYRELRLELADMATVNFSQARDDILGFPLSTNSVKPLKGEINHSAHLSE